MKNTNWRAIAALNAVSTFAQLGQFGVGFLALPIWLAARGMGAIQLGLFGAAEWAGMLAGLLVTPKLLQQLTSKRVVLFGLLSSCIGFMILPQLTWPLWLLPAGLIGFGMGLRWIANETWLYRISPQAVVGQVVGFHEALITLAVIFGPLLVVWFTTAGNLVVLFGALLSGLAALPLLLVASEKVQEKIQVNHPLALFKVDKITKLGIFLAAAGGVIDGAFTALFPIFGLGRGFVETQIGGLLAVIGFGGFVLQFPLGWFSDKYGFMKTSWLVAVTTTLVTFVMAFVAMPFATLIYVGFIFGGFVASFLTLGIIAAASASDHNHMAQNMSKVSIVFTASSIIGALLAGFAGASLGSDALLWLVALASSVLVIIFAQHRQPA
ncbi:MAG: MFS transporter [Methylophilaceae bacterium]